MYYIRVLSSDLKVYQYVGILVHYFVMSAYLHITVVVY